MGFATSTECCSPFTALIIAYQYKSHNGGVLSILQLLIEIIVSFQYFSRCLLYAFSYFRWVLACKYTLIGVWLGVHCKFFHKNHPFLVCMIINNSKHDNICIVSNITKTYGWLFTSVSILYHMFPKNQCIIAKISWIIIRQPCFHNIACIRFQVFCCLLI